MVGACSAFGRSVGRVSVVGVAVAAIDVVVVAADAANDVFVRKSAANKRPSRRLQRSPSAHSEHSNSICLMLVESDAAVRSDEFGTYLIARMRDRRQLTTLAAGRRARRLWAQVSTPPLQPATPGGAHARVCSRARARGHF